MSGCLVAVGAVDVASRLDLFAGRSVFSGSRLSGLSGLGRLGLGGALVDEDVWVAVGVLSGCGVVLSWRCLGVAVVVGDVGCVWRLSEKGGVTSRLDLFAV